MRGFSLIEVIIAFSIAVLGIAVSYQIIGVITQRMKYYDYEKYLKEFSFLQSIYISELKNKRKKELRLSEEIKVGNLVFKHCTRKENYTVCELYLRHPAIRTEISSGIFYIPEKDFLFTR